MGAPSLHAELANLQGCTECGTEDTQEGFGPRTCLMCSSCNLRFSHVVRARSRPCRATAAAAAAATTNADAYASAAAAPGGATAAVLGVPVAHPAAMRRHARRARRASALAATTGRQTSSVPFACIVSSSGRGALRHVEQGRIPRTHVGRAFCALGAVWAPPQECCERARGISISADATRSDTTWFCSPSCQRVHDEIDGLVAKLEPLADERRLELLPAGTAGDRGAKLRRDGSAQREAALKILQSAFGVRSQG